MNVAIEPDLGDDSTTAPAPAQEPVDIVDDRDSRSVFRNMPFMRLWASQAISQTANNMVNFALLLRVREIIEHHDLSQANTLTSLEILAFSLPSVFVGPLAGVIADRVDRRTLMAGTHVLRAVAMVLFLVIQPSWQVEAILISTYVVTLVFGTAGQFFAPAEGATIPDLVPRSQLMSANGLFNITNTGAQLVGFALLGTLFVKLFGVNAVFGTCLVLFLICAGLMLTLPPSKAGRERISRAAGGKAMRGLWADVGEGIAFIRHDPYLVKAILHLSIAAMTIQMIAALGPEFVTDVIGLSSEDLLFLVGPAASGVFLGVIFVGQTTRRYERSSVIDWALAFAGVSLLLMVLTQPVLSWVGNPSRDLLISVAAVFAAFLGVCNAYVLIPAQTMLQERSHEHVRARVYATFFTISNTLAFVPIVFAAVLADLLGVVNVLVIVSLLIAAIGGQSVVRRRVEERAMWRRSRRLVRDGPEAISPGAGKRRSSI